MPKPVCVKCQRFYRPERNSVSVLEQMPTGSEVEPGTSEPQSWRPYKLWYADKWKCRGCGHELIVGFGRDPVAEHYQEKFHHQLAKASPYIVNDC